MSLSTKFRFWGRVRIEEALNGELDFDQLDSRGVGALHWAIDNNERDLFQLALEAGAPVNQATAYIEDVPLHCASYCKSPFFIDALIAHGADIDKSDRSLITSLHIAAEKGFLKHVRKLVAAGCSLRPLNEYKRSPLDLAFMYGRVEVIDYLVTLPEARHRSWSDRLPLAVERVQADVVRWLLDRGANPDRKDSEGRRPIDIARRLDQRAPMSNGQRQVLSLIEQALIDSK